MLEFGKRLEVVVFILFSIKGSHLCPGQYNSKSFTDELSERVVSKRGPYDLFTGSRNKPITVGHFAVPVRKLSFSTFGLSVL
jgi:hypothetical protein